MEPTTQQPKPTDWNKVRAAVLKKYPSLTKSQLSKLDEAIKKRQVRETVNLGIVSPEDVASSYPDVATQAVASGIPAKKKSESELKVEKTKSKAESLITQLEDSYFGAEGAQDDLSRGRIQGAVSGILATFGRDSSLKNYRGLRKSARPELARATGEVGSLTEPEQRAAVELLPTGMSTKEEALKGFESIRKRFGLPERDLSNIAPEPVVQRPQSLEDIYYQRATPITNPNASEEQRRKEAAIAGDFIEAGMGMSLVSRKDVDGLLGSIKSFFGKTARPIKAGAAVRSEAVSQAQSAGKTVNGDAIVADVEQWAQKVTPNLRTKAAKIAQDTRNAFSGKSLTPDDAFSLWDEASKGFTAAGKKAKTLEAGYNRTLRDSVRVLLDEVAPGFEKGTKTIAQGYQRQRILKPFVRNVGQTAGGVGIGIGLQKLFGGQER